MLHELIWALVALSLLGLLLLLFTVNSNNTRGVRFIRLDDFLSEGLMYAVFMVAFMIVVLPLYPIYALLAAVWHKYHPPAAPVTLPVEGDDPIWGRTVNRKLVEVAFLAVQQAWMQRETESLKAFVGSEGGAGQIQFTAAKPACRHGRTRLPLTALDGARCSYSGLGPAGRRPVGLSDDACPHTRRMQYW